MSNKPFTMTEKSSKTPKHQALRVMLMLTSITSLALGVLYYTSLKPEFEEALLPMANKINISCPFKVDELTRLDNTTVFPGNVFQYNYTLFTIYKQDVDVKKAITNLEPIIIANVKKDPEMKALRDMKTTINYYYRDLTGEFIFMIVLTPEKYLRK